MVLESSLSDKQRLKYQKMYTIDLNDLTDNPGLKIFYGDFLA